MGPGGSERQLTEIAKGLDASRFAVHVGFFREGIRLKELQDARIPCFRIGIRSFIRPHAIAGAVGFAQYLLRHRIQIVHAFDYPLTCFGVPIAKASGVPVVLSSQRGHRSLIPKRYLRMVRWTDRLVNGIIVNCGAMERHLVNDERIESGKIHLCYNGIDVRHFCPAVGEGAPQPLPGEPVVVGSLGLMRPEKNLSLLVKAFSRLAERYVTLKLLLIGDGPEKKPLREMVDSLGLGERCVFMPVQESVPEWLRLIDIFVLPSATEALSNSLMEAMACGCAAIASNAGGSPEVIEPGKTGLLFENGSVEGLTQQLDLLVRNSALRHELSKRASASIRDGFSLESAAQRMGTIYERILNVELAL
jgi:L-malate glycosyltransferase